MSKKSKKLTWVTADLRRQSDRDALFLQEEKKAAQRVKQAVDKLKNQGIVDEHGNLLSNELPKDMQPTFEYKRKRQRRHLKKLTEMSKEAGLYD